jgi:thiol-disulfide isomerase/thioredoxin
MQSFLLSLLTAATAVAGSTALAEGSPPKLSVGDQPPKYVGRDLGGPDVTIDLTSGKAYVISFWASWCGPCLQELPVLANIQAIAGNDKMQVVAVNIEASDVYRRLRRNIIGAGLTSTFDPDQLARKAFGVGAIPHMVIVGRNGRISAIRTGYSKASHEELAAALNEALAVEPAAASKQMPAATQ